MDADDPRIGQVLQGRYRIIELIATGTMGAVYRGVRLQLGRKVAVKFLHPQFASDQELLARFEHEAKAMSRLTHPHCVGVLDFGVSGSPYVVMEYAPGATLKDQLRDGPMAPGRVVGFARQILAGLAHAHARGIIHRDIKPANLVFCEATGMDYQLRIVDFGLAKIADLSALSHGEIVLGTPSYMSPEQAQGQPATVRSDIYAVGAVLFEMISGQKPFSAGPTFQVITDRMDQSAPPLRLTGAGGGVSSELESAVRRAMAKNPGDRFGSALEFADALAATPEGRMERPEQRRPAAPQPAPPPQTVTRRRPRRRWPRLVLALLAVAVLCAGWLGWTVLERGQRLPTRPRPVATTAPATSPPSGPPASGPPASGPSTRGAGDAAMASELPARGTLSDASPDAALNDAGLPDKAPRQDGRAAARVDQQASSALPTPIGLKHGIRRAHRLAAAYNTGAALKLLGDLRRRFPNSAYVSYLQGNLYAQHKWWWAALRAYQAAVAANPIYRKKAELIRNVVAALASRRRRTRRLAIKVINETIGDHAIPHLKAAQALGGPRVKRRAIARLLRKLSPPRPAPPGAKRKKQPGANRKKRRRRRR